MQQRRLGKSLHHNQSNKEWKHHRVAPRLEGVVKNRGIKPRMMKQSKK